MLIGLEILKVFLHQCRTARLRMARLAISHLMPEPRHQLFHDAVRLAARASYWDSEMKAPKEITSPASSQRSKETKPHLALFH
jgi:hypothetical protein